MINMVEQLDNPKLKQTKLEQDAFKLWEPSSISDKHMEKFRLHVNKKFSLEIGNYTELYKWSIQFVSDFWTTVWEYTSIKGDLVLCNSGINAEQPMDQFPKEWFSGSKLNYAENLLSFCDLQPDKIAIYNSGEYLRGVAPTSITYGELKTKVSQFSKGLKELGLNVGDRVAGYLPNSVEAVVAMLACASLGIIWSSTSPDFGAKGVLDRFQQIEPKLLISVNATIYNGKVHDHLLKLKQVVDGLEGSLKRVVVVPFIQEHSMDIGFSNKAVIYNDFLGSAETLEFIRLPFDQPLFILFSSGTTGKPKCLVHTAGGMLLQHKKEHMLHGNLGESDIFLQYTTVGWMMWNWMVSALSLGTTIVLYDGSPFQPHPWALFELVDLLGITALGTSAKFIQSLEETKIPNPYSLESLHSLYSTGSPLKPESFDFVYNKIKADLLLGSITGGTDICSLFAGHNAILPVYRGEIQCRCLGMAIQSYDLTSAKEIYDESGDLICTKVFPCMPCKFWGDDSNFTLYKKAYFDVLPNTWYHGDFVSINSYTGGLVMLGRSDGTLNPSGVRFGSAEIYNVIEGFPEIEDSVVVGQKLPPDFDDERVILFLQLKSGSAKLSPELVTKIKTKIRILLSPRHVPSLIMSVQDIPYTINGKKVEVAVKKIINGIDLDKIAIHTIKNPEALKYYINLPELKFD